MTPPKLCQRCYTHHSPDSPCFQSIDEPEPVQEPMDALDRQEQIEREKGEHKLDLERSGYLGDN